MRTSITLLILICFGIANALDRPRGSRVPRLAAYPEKWWQQKLDHFDSSSPTWPQRYFEVLDNWRAPDGPFILYIAGEGPQDGPAGVGDELAVVAKQNGAAVLTLEHRFFGKSLPFADLSVPHLRFLTVAQELEDLAAFMVFYQKTVNAKYGRPETARNKVLAAGGSYAGMIASHLRFVHPEIVDVAWSFVQEKKNGGKKRHRQPISFADPPESSTRCSTSRRSISKSRFRLANSAPRLSGVPRSKLRKG